MAFSLRLLGGFALCDEAGAPLAIPLQKARAVVAVLALQPRGRATRQELTALLWSQRWPAQAQQSLRQTLHLLKRDLAAAGFKHLEMDRRDVWLDLGALTTDAVVLRDRLTAGCAPAAEVVLALPCGRFLDGVTLHDPAGDAWIADRAAEFRDGVARLTLAALQQARRAEREEDVAALAHRLLEIDPAAEAAHRALIAHHLAGGERSLAVRQFQLCRKALAQELSTTPTRETLELMREAAEPRASTQARPAPPKLKFHAPSLLVEPFVVRDDARRTRLLAYGLVDDLVVDLSRLSLLGVIPPGAVSLGPAGGAREIGVDYVLGGSVESGGAPPDAPTRISAVLRHAASGRTLWAERYQRMGDDLWSVREDIVGRIANTTCRAVDLAEMERLDDVDTRSRDAWTLRVLGQKNFLLYSRAANARARTLFGQALALDPAFAQAETGIGWTHLEDFCFSWSDRPAGSLAAAEQHARRVLQRSGHYYAALHLLSYVELCRREFERSADTCARARDDNPNDADLLLHQGYVMSCGGAPEPAIDLMLQAAAINPMHPNWYRLLIGNAALDAGRPRAAAVELTRFIDGQAGAVSGVKAQAIRTRAAAHAMAGDIDSARVDRDIYMAANRQFSVATFRRTFPRRSPEIVARQADALVVAGFPD